MHRVIFEDFDSDAWRDGCHIGGESCAAAVRLVTERGIDLPSSSSVLPAHRGQIQSEYRRKWGSHRRLYVVEFDVVDHAGMTITCGLCTLDADRLELVGAVASAPHLLARVFSPAGQGTAYSEAEACERLLKYLRENRGRFFGRDR
jgi:hypothetical protein